jgi:hypothetical protein
MSGEKHESVKVILARIEEKQDNMAAQLKTHLHHHWAASIVMLGSGISIVGACIVAFFRSILP